MYTLPDYHYSQSIKASDLSDFARLVPPSGALLVQIVGLTAALNLFGRWPGVQVMVPKGPCNNPGGAKRWGQMVAILGTVEAMQSLADAMGGSALEVPTLDALRLARRNRALRAQFDRLTTRSPNGQGLSKAAAVYELGLCHAPMTARQIEIILDRPSPELCAHSPRSSDLLSDLLF